MKGIKRDTSHDPSMAAAVIEDGLTAFRYEGPSWADFLEFCRNSVQRYEEVQYPFPAYIPEYIRISSISFTNTPQKGRLMIVSGVMLISLLAPTVDLDPVNTDSFLHFWGRKPVHVPEDPGQEVDAHP